MKNKSTKHAPKAALHKTEVRRMVDCPMCLFSSGIVADGKGTKCSNCGGLGVISKAKYNRLVDDLGDIVGQRCA